MHATTLLYFWSVCGRGWVRGLQWRTRCSLSLCQVCTQDHAHSERIAQQRGRAGGARGSDGAEARREGELGLQACDAATGLQRPSSLESFALLLGPLVLCPEHDFRHVGHSGCSVSLPSCPLRFSLTPSQEAHPDYRYDSSFPVLASPTHPTQSSLPMASPSARSSASRIPSPSSLSMQSRHTRPVS